MNIPSGILEASNGALWLVLAFAACGSAWWLASTVRQIGSFKQVYLEEKASIALLCAFGGLAVRLCNVWWMQHQQNHGVARAWADGAQTFLHIGATLVAIIGVMCWLRCTLPVALGWSGWAVLTTAALAFGIWNSL